MKQGFRELGEFSQVQISKGAFLQQKEKHTRESGRLGDPRVHVEEVYTGLDGRGVSTGWFNSLGALGDNGPSPLQMYKQYWMSIAPSIPQSW